MCAMLLQGRLQDRVLQMSLFTASMHSFLFKMWPSGKMEMEHLGEMKLPEVSKFGPHPMAESKSKAVRQGIDTIRGCNQEVEDGKHPHGQHDVAAGAQAAESLLAAGSQSPGARFYEWPQARKKCQAFCQIDCAGTWKLIG